MTTAGYHYVKIPLYNHSGSRNVVKEHETF